MGPWVPSVAVSHQKKIRSFLTHHVELNLARCSGSEHPSRCSNLIILRVVLDLFVLPVVLGLMLDAVSARLVPSPCSFTLLVVLDASCLRTLVQ